ncbi:hypothetical protein A3F59_06410 [Candidatus Roizmanbacteria bacterium RIFCSPHIGHO2_12_FULL_38_13]|nr:MAG: hypothetical protein A2684_00045 [Candidatus Levybacteria bacterium RIFCSPHIGHO2_01_FULL_36_15b]OGK34644.1 MAG: hypothetical protein A3F59_06410 [Candidatus Roizmanbacteria bacterium RIFCSPHIGHO2_12_FULL_38_13]
MKEIILLPIVGTFAEDKDKARDIRLNKIIPILDVEKQIILNFEGIESATQSFIHALISDIIRQKGSKILDNIYFKSCNENIQKIINIVVEYMQV